MKYLKNFLKICARHSDNDCDGCPFAWTATHQDCHRYILKYPEDAQRMINEYVLKAIEPLGKMENGKYRERCSGCGMTHIIEKRKIVYDSYMEDYVYTCPNCKTLQNAIL